VSVHCWILNLPQCRCLRVSRSELECRSCLLFLYDEPLFVVISQIFIFVGIVLTLIGMSMAGTSSYSLTPVVLRELIGIENLTSGMGLVMAFQSTAFICSTYITG